ncbi:hypothetical protein DHEL01_v212990 [Diaporthe helianthi]|uniref:CFEM domain-containing protein n=1 Tax=Diaporthe helianthi TaxID=158607 RepID=A0A2P5HED1_DIAHE|nr:hypothetical protein DHEL01_v212990 [Diaporthe helianthi]
MKAFSVALLFGALVGSSFAEVSTPACAADCLATYLPQSGCNATDAPCICSDVTLNGQVQNCTLAACTTREALTALNATKTSCGEPVRDLTVITPVVTAVSGTFAIVAVVMRLVDSFNRGNMLNWSNLLIILALVSVLKDVCAGQVTGMIIHITLDADNSIVSTDGFGRDIWTLPHDNITEIIMVNILQLVWISEIMYMVVLGLTKIAMLLLYLKVFPGQTSRRVCFVMIGLCLAYIPATALATFFHCTPVSYNWTNWTGETEGSCFSFNTFAWAQSSINIVLDLIIISLPMPQLWKLNMGRKKRIQIVLMFSVGLFITIVSVVRLTALVNFATTTNATYDNVPTAYWSVLEIFVSIICCCMPAVRSLLKTAFPSCFGSSTDTKTTPRPYITPNSPGYKLSGGIQKSTTNTVTFGPISADGVSHSSNIELVDERWRDRD